MEKEEAQFEEELKEVNHPYFHFPFNTSQYFFNEINMNMTQIESKEDEDEEEDDYNGDDPDGIEEYGEDIAIDDMST